MEYSFKRVDEIDFGTFAEQMKRQQEALDWLLQGGADPDEVAAYAEAILESGLGCKGMPSGLFWGYDEPQNLPGDARVDFFYMPTYLNTAFLMQAYRTMPQRMEEIPDFTGRLTRAMKASAGRSFKGNGSDQSGFVRGMQVFASVHTSDFIRDHKDLVPETFASRYQAALDLIEQDICNEEEYLRRIKENMEVSYLREYRQILETENVCSCAAAGDAEGASKVTAGSEDAEAGAQAEQAAAVESTGSAVGASGVSNAVVGSESPAGTGAGSAVETAADETGYVWYACYGSNINRKRFMRYINACKDKTPPVEDRPYEFEHPVFFAGQSIIWEGKGTAFLDTEAAGHAYGRIYKITKEQYLTVSEKEGPRYRNKLDLGMLEEIPVVSFTCENRLDEERNIPSLRYLDTILKGLTETYPEYDAGMIAKELTGGVFSPEEVRVLKCLREAEPCLSNTTIMERTCLDAEDEKKAIADLLGMNIIRQDKKSRQFAMDEGEAVFYLVPGEAYMIDLINSLQGDL